MTTALVLGGGGAKGDFEVGAVLFLYEQNIRPDIICGTSVGSINAVKLAEGEGALAALESIWRSMRVNADMYLEEPWFTSIDNSDVKKFFKQTALEKTIDVAAEVGKAWLFFPWAVYDLIRTGEDIDDLNDAIQLALRARSVYNLNPIREKLKTFLDHRARLKWALAGHSLLLSVVSLESGSLRYVTETGMLLERDGRTPVPVPTRPFELVSDEAFAAGNELSDLRRQLLELEQQPPEGAHGQRSAEQIREIDHKRREVADKQQQLNRLNLEQPPRQVPVGLDMAEGVLASASIPGVFGPVKLLDETYVDGGVRAAVPIEAAVRANAETIYAVLATQPHVDPAPSFDDKGLLDIARRAVIDVLTNEITRSETTPLDGWGARAVNLIYPLSDIHDTLTVDPGLIAISIDYGYMRAADVVRKLEDHSPTAQLADQISTLRRDAWDLECRLHCQPVPYPPDETLSDLEQRLRDKHGLNLSLTGGITALYALRTIKLRIRELINSRRAAGGAVRPDIDSSWKSWEPHPWRSSIPSPWDQISANGMTVPAQDPLGGIHPVPTPPALATFVSQSVPEVLRAGERATVSVTIRNSGTSTWRAAESYRLGSQTPQSAWGVESVELPRDIAPGDVATFTFEVAAPAVAGSYDFQWRMARQMTEWFGETSPLVSLRVVELVPVQRPVSVKAGYTQRPAGPGRVLFTITVEVTFVDGVREEVPGASVLLDDGTQHPANQPFTARGEIGDEPAAGVVRIPGRSDTRFRYAGQADGNVYDLVSDFSATPAAPGGSGVFRYGYTDSPGSPLIPYRAGFVDSPVPGVERFTDGANDCPVVIRNTTGAPASYVGTITQPADMLNLHPGPAGQYCVVRFIAPSAGTYRLLGSFQGIDFGYGQTNTNVGLLLNSNAASPLFSGNVMGFDATQPFDLSVRLEAGQTLDFFVGLGGNGYYSDSTGLKAIIRGAA